MASSEKVTSSLKSTESGAGATRRPHHHQSQRSPSESWGGSWDHGYQSGRQAAPGRGRRRNTSRSRRMLGRQPRKPPRTTSTPEWAVRSHHRRQIHHGPVQGQKQPDRQNHLHQLATGAAAGAATAAPSAGMLAGGGSNRRATSCRARTGRARVRSTSGAGQPGKLTERVQATDARHGVADRKQKSAESLSAEGSCRRNGKFNLQQPATEQKRTRRHPGLGNHDRRMVIRVGPGQN